LGEGGSHEVAHLIKTHNPLVALVAGRGQKHETIGASWVVVPGDLSEGEYSLLTSGPGSWRRATSAKERPRPRAGPFSL